MMDSLVAQSTGKVVVALIFSVAASLWMLALLTNFRGIRDRNLKRTLALSAKSRRLVVPDSAWMSEETRVAFARVSQIVVISVILLGTTTFAVLMLIALILTYTG